MRRILALGDKWPRRLKHMGIINDRTSTNKMRDIFLIRRVEQR